jgi:hypothetical protein
MASLKLAENVRTYFDGLLRSAGWIMIVYEELSPHTPPSRIQPFSVLPSGRPSQNPSLTVTILVV